MIPTGTILQEIRSWLSGDVLFSMEVDVAFSLARKLKVALETAARRDTTLHGADLTRASLYGASLEGASLEGANLEGANLYGANLEGANLTRVNLDSANLYNANLKGASLSGASLSGANLAHANLTRANLEGANLYYANLTNANLVSAGFHNANLYGADLTRANLKDARLHNANLTRANFEGVVNISPAFAACPMACPEDGAYTGWKQCRDAVLVKLLIPASARRSSANGRKCRAEFVSVIEVIGATVGVSNHDDTVVYRVGETVRCHKWGENRWAECSGGIHHFITKQEAIDY